MLRMSNDQFEFSEMFWDDKDFSLKDGIPKYYVEINNEFQFVYLDSEETKEFLKLKSLKNPELMRNIRYLKIMRIFNKINN